MASVTVCTFLFWYHILAQHQEECGERAKLSWTPTKHNGTLSQTQMLEFISIPWQHVCRTCVFLASLTPPRDLACTGAVKEALLLVSLSDRPLMEKKGVTVSLAGLLQQTPRSHQPKLTRFGGSSCQRLCRQHREDQHVSCETRES